MPSERGSGLPLTSSPTGLRYKENGLLAHDHPQVHPQSIGVGGGAGAAVAIEINRLVWDDVDFDRRTVTLWTRKKKEGHLTPRTVAMTDRLFRRVWNRHVRRDSTKPWVFWHTYRSKKTGERQQGPYQERKKIMRTLCRKAGVRYFRFHALRHLGASTLDREGINTGTIQKILGHESRMTTEIYLHSLGSAEREARAVLERITEKVSHQFSHLGKIRLRLVR